jgi:cytochrome c1
MNKIDKEELKRLRSRTKVVFITMLFLLIFLAVIALAKK